MPAVRSCPTSRPSPSPTRSCAGSSRGRAPAAAARPRLPHRRPVAAARGAAAGPAAVRPARARGSPTTRPGRSARWRWRRWRRSATAAAARRRLPPTRTCSGSWSSRSAGPTWGPTSRCSRRSSPTGARTAGRRPGTRPISPRTRRSRWRSSAPGMSGLVAAHRLRQAGDRPTWSFEKNADVGGTWYENTYPGCRVDNPNHNYSYSFAQRHDWPFHYSPQPVLRRLLPRLRRGVRRARGRPVPHRGAPRDVVRRRPPLDRRPSAPPAAATRVLVADAVISAVGQLNRPEPPRHRRVATRSRAPRSTRRGGTTSVDLAGKRVAVIGTGASAMQFVPEIAPIVGSCWSSSAPRRGWAPHPTTRSPWPTSCAGCTATSPATRVEPLLHVLAHRRRCDRRRRGRSRVGRWWRVGERDQRLPAPDAARLHHRPVRRPPRPARGVHPALSARRQADHPRRRVVGPAPSSGTTSDCSTAAASVRSPRGGSSTADGTEHEVDVIIYGTGFTARRSSSRR